MTTAEPAAADTAPNGDLARLRALEESLWDDESRFDRVHLDAVLHPDFLEFGQSGRTWDRAATLAVEPEPIGATPLQEFDVDLVSTDVALVTYQVTDQFGPGGSERHTRRSSLWLRTPEGWRLRFHQGTPIPDEST